MKNEELLVLVENIKKEIKTLFAEDFSGHDYWHSERVYHNAMLILSKEQGDPRVVALASLLHDADDVKLFNSENYGNARKIMHKWHIDDVTINQVIEVIKTVSFKGKDTVTPNSIEGKIVQDADRLDAIGAVGIARVFAYGGSRQRAIYDPESTPKLEMTEDEYRNNKGTSIDHFYEKLFLLKDMMNTETAIKIAQKRDAFMREYIEQFYEEWNGNR